MFEIQHSDNDTFDSRTPGWAKLEMGIGAEEILSVVSYVDDSRGCELLISK